ncbi:hypothetical protein [Clostridium sp.]
MIEFIPLLLFGLFLLRKVINVTVDGTVIVLKKVNIYDDCKEKLESDS